ncbi:9493_t:CDS:2 [Acaulospora morrowiae]|uniref:9493_t:CDS:1 n=1 Tax=Acaulospora morrowiae TaxID=94023 RepID=A0A9N8VV80_9GLOM|nr:9493_t:CDS:2 [Acaulospora morrowiae]
MVLYQDILSQVFECTLNDSRVDLLERIFTLHSCILVNRTWCTSGYQILWREPFTLLSKLRCVQGRHTSLTSTYLKCLPEDVKFQFIESRAGGLISLNSPAFDYSKALKKFSYVDFQHSIFHWINTHISSDISNLIFDQEFVSGILIKHLMQHTKLKHLCFIQVSSECAFEEFLPHMNYTDITRLPGAVNFFESLTSLASLKILSTSLLNGIAGICHSIDTLCIDCDETNDEGWATLINAQSNLINLKITARNTNHPLIRRALRNKVNTLISLSLVPIYTSMDTFLNCIQLRELEIEETSEYATNTGLFQFFHSTFPKLESLSVKILSVSYLFHYLTTFIRNHCGSLRVLKVTCVQGYLQVKREYLDSYSAIIVGSCTNLLEYTGPLSITKIPLLFRQCNRLFRVNLLSNEFLSISICEELEQIGDLLPRNLAQIKIPSEFKFTTDALRRFLQSCEKRSVRDLEFDVSRYSSELQIILDRYKMKGVLNKKWAKKTW